MLVNAFLSSAACANPAQPAARPSPWWGASQTPGALQTAAFRGVPGSAANRCVAVGRHRNARSFEFLAGPFGVDEQVFTADYRQGARTQAVKIYRASLHVDHMSALTVQATLALGPTKPAPTHSWEPPGRSPSTRPGCRSLSRAPGNSCPQRARTRAASSCRSLRSRNDGGRLCGGIQTWRLTRTAAARTAPAMLTPRDCRAAATATRAFDRDTHGHPGSRCWLLTGQARRSSTRNWLASGRLTCNRRSGRRTMPKHGSPIAPELGDTGR
jgi:hypothetical protein